jgi:hypothetical protein
MIGGFEAAIGSMVEAAVGEGAAQSLMEDDFHRIARGHHRDGSCRPSEILHDHHYRPLECDCSVRLSRTTRSKNQ